MMSLCFRPIGSMASRGRFAIFFCVLLSLAALTGCSWVGVGRGFAPPGFGLAHDAGRLTDPMTMGAAYRELFADDPSLWLSNVQLTLDRRWLPDPRPLTENLSYIATGEGSARLRVSNPHLAAPLMDVLLDQGRMTVTLAGDQRVMFTGPVGPNGSPFRRAMGFEPADLRMMFMIGQRIGHEAWTCRRHWRTVTLTPVRPDAETGLEEIRLDRATGLPKSAQWRRGDECWEVDFENWAMFSGGEAGSAPRLMPSRLTLRPDRPAVALTLEVAPQGYRFGRKLPPKAFQPPRAAGARVEPLERLLAPLMELIES